MNFTGAFAPVFKCTISCDLFKLIYISNYFDEETKMAVTAALVKELRERTAAGMLDCKNALVETDGDIELAIENMRKNGQAKAAKKAGRIAAEGVILTKVVNGAATMMEVNSETDFVARDANFNAFAQQVVELGLENKAKNVAETLAISTNNQDLETIRTILLSDSPGK